MLKLHYHPFSTFARRVRIALLEKDIPAELIEVDMVARAHRGPAYLALNPYGRVPTLEEDGFVVKVSDLVAIEVADEPGGLARILTTIEKARVNLEYMYGFTLKQEGKGLLAFRFDDPDRAIEALQKKGLRPVQSVELFKRLET